MMFKFIYVLLAVSQINAEIPLKFVSDLDSKLGLGWPHSLTIVEGHDALLKLTKTLVNQQKCEITTTKGVTFDVASPPSNRFEIWSNGCGVRIKRVTKEDEGRWRITANRGEFNYTGYSEVHVIDEKQETNTTPIHIEDGSSHTLVNLTSLHNSYCLVTQPFAENFLVPGHCLVTLDRTTRAMQGSWGVLLGIVGRVSEYSVQRHVAVEAERLDVGYIRDTQTNKLHLYCNILNTHKNISFCRFQMTAKSTGFNVLDGMSDGSYSYFGDGFLRRQCGLTVEHPSSEDFGSWRCSVGVQELVGATVVQHTPKQALISVPNTRKNGKKVVSKKRTSKEIKPIFAQQDKETTINCRAEVSLSYCWFQGPNGQQYSPYAFSSEDQSFWYTGEGLSMGDCGITFAHATADFTGSWTCHMGPGNELGIEVTDTLQVRVTGALAAFRKEVDVEIGGTTTLYCLSASGNRPLGYCRFLSPDRVGINVDSSVTAEQAILGRYYFTPGRDIDHGDCSIDIQSIEEIDIGTWTCAALVSGEIVESSDSIAVTLGATNAAEITTAVPEETEDIYPSPSGVSRAGIFGMVFGIAALLSILAGVVWYKRFRKNVLRNNSVATSRVELSMEMAASTPRTSNSSDETRASSYVNEYRKSGTRSRD